MICTVLKSVCWTINPTTRPSFAGCEQNEFCVQFSYFGSVSSATWHLSHLRNYSYISWLHQFNLFNVKVTFFSRKWIYWYLMILNKFKIFWVMVRVWGGGGGGSKKTKNTSCILWKSPMIVHTWIHLWDPYLVINHFSYALMICPL